MNLHVVKRGIVAELRDKIEKHYDRYVSGDFSDILKPEYAIAVKDTEVDLDELARLTPKSGGEYDAENALIVFNAIKGINRYLARDERLWVWLTHGPCLEYTRKRWLIKGAKKEQHIAKIRDHFFATGARGFERSNAISCLWWWAEIVSHYQHSDLPKALKILLHQTDVRTSIIERPTSSQSAFSSIMSVLIAKYDSDEQISFFKRERGDKAVYRRWLTEINRHGGVTFYEALPENEVTSLFHSLALKARVAAPMLRG